MTPPRPIYRTGRTVGRTIYLQTGDGPSKKDRVIGMLDTPQLAEFAVAAMNLAVRAEAEGMELTRARVAAAVAEPVTDWVAGAETDITSGV